MHHPLITIGMTAYNAQANIEAAVNSALAQDWPNTEIVIVDDASTDETWSILQMMSSQNPAQVHVYRQDENGGVAAARNRIITEARGEFIAFFDDDDESASDRVRQQFIRLTDYEHNFAQGALAICHTARRQIYPHGFDRIERTIGEQEGRAAPSGQDVVEMILFNHPVEGGNGALATCSQMARRSVYQTLGGFDPAFRRVEDTDFNLRLARAGGHFVGIGDPLVIQTMTHGSHKRLSDERQYVQMLYHKHRDVLEDLGRYAFDIAWINAKYDYLEGKKFAFVLALIRLFMRYPRWTIARLGFATRNVEHALAQKDFHAGRQDAP